MGGSQRGGFAGCFMLLLSRRWYYEYRIFADRLKKAGFSDLPFRVCDRMFFSTCGRPGTLPDGPVGTQADSGERTLRYRSEYRTDRKRAAQYFADYDRRFM